MAANFKRDVAASRLTDPLSAEFKFALLTTLMAYCAWLRTEEGTRWLLHLYGIRILRPHPGYAYFYQTERLVEPEFGLRIYEVDRSGRTMQSPVEYYGARLRLIWAATDEAAQERKSTGEGVPKRAHRRPAERAAHRRLGLILV